ncbi:cytochrome P450-dit2 [Rhizopus stolonifer]|uniref:Cytochrome P450-dit2 n=1 Tax=Rhizopus stolonifer TaxID=4846 RepID=A0A367J0S7_RHIST|nr:cytochrome P450-dit2 [Rhizopus stolonifer]
MTRLFFVLFQIFDDQLKWLFPSRVEAHQRLDHLLKRIDEMIALKRVTVTEKIGSLDYYSTTSDAEKDLLTLMMEAEIAGEGKLSDEELRRNMVMFFFAGHDTTAAGMSFAIGQLARHQEIQKKAREEVVSVLGDHVEDIPSIESIKKMPYLDAIVKETLRLNSPITKTLPRIAARDVAVDGLLIPQGTLVDVDIAATHMSEANYSDPFEFKPERFLESADVTSTKQGLSYVPFGYGSHVCIGQNFSLVEQRVFLAMLLRKFEWTLALDSVHRDGMIAEGNGGVRPINLRIDFKPRF